MNIYLTELIDLLEDEGLRLETIMKACVAESDYKHAHKYQKALHKVNRQLQTLNGLQDPSYKEKSMLKHTQEIYIKYLADPKYAGMTDYFLDKMNETQQKLYIPSASPPQYDTQEIDDALFQLVEKKITGFKFNLQKQSNLYLRFQLIGHSLKLSITPFKELMNEDVLYKEEKKALKSLGFTNSLGKEYLYCMVDVSRFKDALAIKTLLARIVFEVFFYRELDRPATIEIYA